MPDPSVLTWAIVAIALALLGCAVECLGRFSPAQPVCRRCGEDARGAIWRDPVACRSCGANLAAHRAVRCRRTRRSKRAIVSWILLLGIGLVVVWKDRWFAERSLRWRDGWPALWDAAQVWDARAGAVDPERFASLWRRLKAGALSEGEARVVATRLLDVRASEVREWLPFLRVGWDGAAFEAWLRAQSNTLAGVAVRDQSLKVWAGNETALKPIYPSCTVDRLTVDGVERSPTMLDPNREVSILALLGSRPTIGEHAIAFEALLVTGCDGVASVHAREALQRGDLPTSPYVALRVRVSARVDVQGATDPGAQPTATLLDSRVEFLPFTPPRGPEP